MTHAYRPLYDRLADFSYAVGQAARSLPRDPVAANLATQLARSCDSPRANYGEAQDAVSDREYVFKMKTCVKELRETLGSLGMARRHGYTNADFAALERECNELIAITVTCIKKARSRYEEWPETKKGKR